ncbi:SRPBCC domain-containing protein [Flavihumibacter sp. RY-1]|uniref:SRPBCC domain-containing protein n=1 Tax=Flavihumibacter fluminis TaxID=2909236 RepID=A0ABS9BKD8_9BACT|nr:SRPBCC domain-containing protein [Flavihumibacter fluminis]MCF1715091.1 SRPBCC domain-containing protein [Flavihumibacter fluminis]
MNKTILFEFRTDKENKRIHVERSFDAAVDLVWAAWTEAEILDQWWAPKPWQAVTQSMNFREGGRWFYYMQGPDGEKHWSLFDFEKIIPLKHFSGMDAFCNEQGIINETQPRVQWSNDFEPAEEQTLVRIQLQFEKLEDLETIIQMGFKEGFTAGLENLDQYIAAQFYLRKKNRTDSRARVSTYLNFAGNTDQAFYFYRDVFQSEFINGIQRFGDLPADSSHPPVAENIKNMVLHVELPILGGHILMGTDAPKEMGFTLSEGNNMHIQLEPESRTEADRIFKALSEGGVIEMPMQDMFFGAYFGSFTDKFGINWMIHVNNQKQPTHEK